MGWTPDWGCPKHSCQSECLADSPAKLHVSFSVEFVRSLAFHNIVLFRVKNSVIYSLINILSLSQNKYILSTPHGHGPWWWRLMPTAKSSTQLTSIQSVPAALHALPKGIEHWSFFWSIRQTTLITLVIKNTRSLPSMGNNFLRGRYVTVVNKAISDTGNFI